MHTPRPTRVVHDTPDEHFDDMPLFAGELQPRDNDRLRRVLCEHVPDTFRWLLAHGIRFYGPMPEPPHRKPRMHNVLPNSRAFIRAVLALFRSISVTMSATATC